MADEFVGHVRLGRVERRGMVANVLRAEKDTVGEIFEKHTRLDQSGHGLEPKTADGPDLLIHFAQLRDSIRIEIQLRQAFAVFGARVRLVRRLQRAPDSRPNLMLLWCVGSIRNGIAGVILESDLRDLIAAAAIFGIAKAG